MHFSTVSSWLEWINKIHPSTIDLSLERVKEVAKRLDLLTHSCTIVCVAGTNGKGSTVTALEAIYIAANYRVGIFTSPILFKHQEQVRINGKHPEEDVFCQAFAAIEIERQNITLTTFEFFTLAALWIFRKQPLDMIILEVGLGGRFDAVNMLDADLSIVTSIDMDHQEWLGKTRDAIAYEKAGIFREQKPAIYGDFSPPNRLIEYARKLPTPLFFQGQDFNFTENVNHWHWHYQDTHYFNLPYNGLMIQNMSVVLMAVTLLQSVLVVNETHIHQGLKKINLIGRVHIIPGEITHIYDVAHNPAAIAYLAKCLEKQFCAGKTSAIFSMLADKDMQESIRHIRDQMDAWYLAPLSTSRATNKEQLENIFSANNFNNFSLFENIAQAYQTALMQSQKNDRIIIFGSFHTVAEVSKSSGHF